MLRKIVKIDEEKCNGCGICITACQEGALRIIDGKAKLISDSYCDGLGACLPDCPAGAISVIERHAAEFDEVAVKEHLAQEKTAVSSEKLLCGCPGTHAKVIARKAEISHPQGKVAKSELRQWPCQLRLVSADAQYFDNSHLLVAADCCAYAYANVHDEFMRNKITVIGCPKLDDTDYAAKLTDILRLNEIKSITVLRMEVPCCGGIVNAVKEALARSGKLLPWRVVIIGTDGSICED
ncbi:MAG: ferredoxin [Firmicutes bacterium]|nr:ferredoxin [Bacillota bacterium]